MATPSAYMPRLKRRRRLNNSRRHASRCSHSSERGRTEAIKKIEEQQKRREADTLRVVR